MTNQLRENFEKITSKIEILLTAPFMAMAVTS